MFSKQNRVHTRAEKKGHSSGMTGEKVGSSQRGQTTIADFLLCGTQRRSRGIQRSRGRVAGGGAPRGIKEKSITRHYHDRIEHSPPVAFVLKRSERNGGQTVASLQKQGTTGF